MTTHNLLLSRIYSRLGDLKLTQNEASGRTGMGRSLIRDIKRRARKSPTVKVHRATLYKLAKALQTNTPYLLGESDDKDLRTLGRPPKLQRFKPAAVTLQRHVNGDNSEFERLKAENAKLRDLIIALVLERRPET